VFTIPSTATIEIVASTLEALATMNGVHHVDIAFNFKAKLYVASVDIDDLHGRPWRSFRLEEPTPSKLAARLIAELRNALTERAALN
jgi:hypothetical protein